nr:uncharacterized protein LOC110567173 [Aotus nancymaae]
MYFYPVQGKNPVAKRKVALSLRSHPALPGRQPSTATASEARPSGANDTKGWKSRLSSDNDAPNNPPLDSFSIVEILNPGSLVECTNQSAEKAIPGFRLALQSAAIPEEFWTLHKNCRFKAPAKPPRRPQESLWRPVESLRWNLLGKLRPARSGETARAVSQADEGGCGPPRLAGLAGESAASPVRDSRCAQWEPSPFRFRAGWKGLGGAPGGGRLPSDGAVARRVPGLESARSREAAARPPWAPERCSPRPRSPPGGARKPLWACPQENVVSAVGAVEQASTPLSDPRRGPAPHPHPVFVQGAGSHCVRAGNGGPGNPPPPRSGPLGNSKKTSGICRGSPAFNLQDTPGGGLPEVRSQIRGSFPVPASLIETLNHIEKSLQGFRRLHLTLGWCLNRKRKEKKKRKPSKILPATSGRVLLAPSRRRRAKGRARARGLGSRVAGGRGCRAAALDPGDGEGSKQGGWFLSFAIPVSSSGLPACGSHDPCSRSWVFCQPPRGRLSYRHPGRHLLSRPVIQKIFRGLHLPAFA